MNKLEEVYLKENDILNSFIQSFFKGIEFDKIDFVKNNLKKYSLKKLYEELDDGIEINCKELISKNYFEKKLEIYKYHNKKDYDRCEIVINNERSQIFYKIYKSKKSTIISKQFSNNGQIISMYIDSEKKYILHQNKNSNLEYIDTFEYNSNLNCNIFKTDENNNIEYISKFPYNFIYKSIVLGNYNNENELYDFFEKENKKRKSLDINLLSLEIDDKKIIDEYTKNINFVKENINNLFDNLFANLLNLPQIQEILRNNNIEDIEENKNLSELEILKKQKNELIEIKDRTNEIIKKLKIALEKN